MYYPIFIFLFMLSNELYIIYIMNVKKYIAFLDVEKKDVVKPLQRRII